MLRRRREGNLTPPSWADSAEVICLSVQSLGSRANISCYFSGLKPENWLSALLHIGNTWRTFKNADIWVPPLEILISLVLGEVWALEIFKVPPGDYNVQPRLRPDLEGGPN